MSVLRSEGLGVMHIYDWAAIGALAGALLVGVVAGIRYKSARAGVEWGFATSIPMSILAGIELMASIAIIPGTGFWHAMALTWSLLLGAAITGGMLVYVAVSPRREQNPTVACGVALVVAVVMGILPTIGFSVAPVSDSSLVVRNSEYLAAEANRMVGPHNLQSAPSKIRELAAAGTTIPHTMALSSTWVPTPNPEIVAFDISVRGVSSEACLAFHRASATWTVAPGACVVTPLASDPNIRVVPSPKVG